MDNYRIKMDEQLAALAGSRPRLLLHACCAPCSSSVLEQLCEHFELTLLFYNPNIFPQDEHDRRAAELGRFIAEHGGATLVTLPYAPADFAPLSDLYGALPEGGERCRACYRLRLEKAADYAKEHGFEWLCATLSVSPHKNCAWVNELGEAAAKARGMNWLYADFKKNNGFLRSLRLSDEYGLYRQRWCGCEFSYAQRLQADSSK